MRYPDCKSPLPQPRSLAHGLKNAACLMVYVVAAIYAAVEGGIL